MQIVLLPEMLDTYIQEIIAKQPCHITGKFPFEPRLKEYKYKTKAKAEAALWELRYQ